MKLIHDCVRDVMLFIEKEQGYLQPMNSFQINLPKYSQEDISYTVIQLGYAGYLDIDSITTEGKVYFKDITYAGHQFLDNIRDDNVWSKTLKILNKFKSVSIEIIMQTAVQVILSMLKPMNVS